MCIHMCTQIRHALFPKKITTRSMNTTAASKCNKNQNRIKSNLQTVTKMSNDCILFTSNGVFNTVCKILGNGVKQMLIYVKTLKATYHSNEQGQQCPSIVLN